MYAQAEARAHPRELERCAQERLAQVVAIGGVVAVAVMHRTKRLARREFRGEDAARPHRPPGEVMELVHHGELVALAQVAVEIDVAAEDVGEPHGDAVGDARGVARGEEGALHHARLHRHLGVERGALFARAELFAFARRSGRACRAW